MSPSKADPARTPAREASASTGRPEVGPAERCSPDFDALARPYRWLEYLTFGPLLQRCRTHFLDTEPLPSLHQCRRALVLGDGDGRFTAALMRSLPRIRVHAVDVSPAMLATLTLRIGKVGFDDRLTAEVADLRQWCPATGHTFDLVATHFFLDCLTTAEVKDLSARLKPALAPGSQWLISDFAIPPTPFGHLVARPLVAALYLAFRRLTGLRVDRLPDHESALNRTSWKLADRHTRLFGLLFSELWILNKDLGNAGHKPQG